MRALHPTAAVAEQAAPAPRQPKHMVDQLRQRGNSAAAMSEICPSCVRIAGLASRLLLLLEVPEQVAAALRAAQPYQLPTLHQLRQVAVSYTHLRAHETRHDLVCRLLLEKK